MYIRSFNQLKTCYFEARFENSFFFKLHKVTTTPLTQDIIDNYPNTNDKLNYNDLNNNINLIYEVTRKVLFFKFF